MKSRLVLVEGLPGSGKTTLATSLARALEAQGIAAAWWREEDPEHPATPRSLRRTAAGPGFPARCLASWEALSASTRQDGSVRILEGSAFQSTIRFMLEHSLPPAAILEYVERFDLAVSPLRPRLVYLWQSDPRAFLEDFVHPTRGPLWVARVSSYLSTTPCCRARRWSGSDGMLAFWLLYRELCEEAIGRLAMPVLRIEVDVGRWASAEQGLAWLLA